MGLAWELHCEERRRQRLVPPPVSVDRAAVPPAPVSAATVEVIVTSERHKYHRVTYLRGQRIRMTEAELGVLRGHHVWRPVGSGKDWWKLDRRVLTVEPGDGTVWSDGTTPGALRIAMGCGYDPGNAVYRTHSAVNEYSKHASAFLIWRRAEGNPFHCPQQIDALQQRSLARALVYEADVLHNHVDYFLANTKIGRMARRGQTLLLHYHGSVFPGKGLQHPIANADRDDAAGAFLLGARLTLCALRPDRMHWLPIPMPVDRYAAMVPAERRPGPFRIAHSATREEYKGTRLFLDACDRLAKQGLPVEPVLIGYERSGRGIQPKHATHRKALEIKADCDATFDSFWLGIQGSGLEAAAMGQPVIAGDASVAALYREHVGHVPYTYADGGDYQAQRAALMDVIERLVLDEEFQAAEAERVGAYVRSYHDYRAVARRYEDILASIMGRDDVRTELPKFPPNPQREPIVLPPRRVA